VTKPSASLGGLPARAANGGIVIHLRVTPKALADEVLGVEEREEGTVLKVKVRAVPDKGEANTGVVALVARWLEVPKAMVKVLTGAKSRSKQVFVAGDPPALMARLTVMIGRE